MDRLARNWWMMGVRGVLALAFGTTVLAWPGLDLGGLLVLFACYAIVDGAWTLAASLRISGAALDSWPVALEGLVSLVVGGLALAWPLVPTPDIRMLALWGLATGVVELAVAVRLPRDQAAHWFFGTAAVSSIFLATYLYGLPYAAHTAVARALGIYALVFGAAVLLTAACFRIEPRRARLRQRSGGGVSSARRRRYTNQ